jgi:16S rRNA processing protein RimM
LHDPGSQALDGLRRLWLGRDAGDAVTSEEGLREWRVREARRLEGGFYLLSLDGLCDRTGAEGLRGQCLYADRAELPLLGEDEIYLADLIGCRVVDLAGQEVGVAREAQHVAGNPLLVVERPRRADALVPMVPAILIDVDLVRRLVRIDPPEGLLDLDVGPEQAKVSA